MYFEICETDFGDQGLRGDIEKPQPHGILQKPNAYSTIVRYSQGILDQ